VKWYLFQRGSLGDLHESDEIADIDSETEQYPPTGDKLKSMLDYIMSEKTLPAGDYPVFDASKCPKNLIPSETHCHSCKTELGAPVLIYRRAKVISLDCKPMSEYQTFYKQCPQCDVPYHYQELSDGLFNFNDHILLTFSVLLQIRAGLVNHTAIGRVIGMLEFRIGIKFSKREKQLLEYAYLSFETLVEHDYEFFCMRCGHHPKVLIHDLTKKAVFKYPVSEVKPPDDLTPQVDVDKFWDDITLNILARGFINEGPNPF